MAGKRTNDVPFPIRGTPGGWKDFFDEGDGEVIRHQAEMAERDQALREIVANRRGPGLAPGAPLQPLTPNDRIDPHP
jgi:hypothetical protein